MGHDWNAERFARARRRYRRRLAPRLGGLFAVLIGASLACALTFGGMVWWFGVGVMSGFAFAVVAFLDEFAPEHMRKRQRGLLGEQETRKVLADLEREGWEVVHNVDVGAGDLDHLLSGRAGVYALETKTLLGRVTVENGVLVTRQDDDPEEVHTWTRLPGRLRSLSAEISSWARADAAVRRWVQPVVVVWGDFPERLVEDERSGIVYVHGRELLPWLRTRPDVPTQLSIDPAA
jgi:hypothetical protein